MESPVVEGEHVSSGGDDRGERLGAALRAGGCSALLVVANHGTDPDLAPFVGGARLGHALLVATPERGPRLGYFTPMERGEAEATGLKLLDPSTLDVARASKEHQSPGEFLAAVLLRGLQACSVRPGTLALAGSGHAGEIFEACRALEEHGYSFRSGHQLLRELRKRKSGAEIQDAARSAAAAVEAMHAVAELLAAATSIESRLELSGAPLTVARLRARVSEVFARHGVSQPEGGIMAPGEEGAVPHNSGTAERVIVSGESLVVDLFPKARLFADCTRTFCVGEPAPELAAAHGHVLAALQWSHRHAVPGVTGWELQQGVCGQLEQAGYATPISEPGTTTGYVHGLGHGVGYELHELPTFRDRQGKDRTGVLEPGDVLTLEPGLYDVEQGYGVRLEDMVVVTDSGCDNLTPLPYELDPRAW